MESKYDHIKTEKEIADFWESRKIFKFDESRSGEIFSIDTPPPTVSGDIHMGHVYSYANAEFIARYKRMRGYNVFYPFGLDNNGLPTELLIEKKHNISAEDMSRDKFVEMVLNDIQEYNKKYIDTFKRLGLSIDWLLTYQTISKEVQKISQTSFVELYNSGRIYRKEGPVLYCPKCKTTVSQMELVDKNVESKMVYIKFSADMIIATTRPEMLPACVAIFVNPNDPKNSKLAGKEIEVPLFGQKVKVISDSRVNPEKGSGVVMCCTFGDQTDIEWYKAYGLPLKIIINEEGKMTHPYFEGMNIKDAREKIINDLKKQGLVVKEESIEHAVNTHERCGTEIEYTVKNQWFIKYLDIKDKLLELGESINWYPAHMKTRYANWVRGLQWDWCISRQRYFGIYFPVWYCKKCGKPAVARQEDLPVNPFIDKPKNKCECGSDEFVPETDVLDTWATSSLTPLINAREWLDGKYEKVFPMSLRPQAHDIITFWAFTTIVKSYFHKGSIPWHDIVISGHGLDPNGRAMHKSLGNIIDPLKYFEKYGADAVRYWASSSSLGEDCAFQEKEVVAGSRLINKMWNIARFIEMNCSDVSAKSSNLIDKWITYSMYEAVDRATKAFDSYNYYQARNAAESFFWTLANDYLEFIKYRVYGNDKSACNTLASAFLGALKMFAPFMPFATEKIYQEIFLKNYVIGKNFGENRESIHLTEWPKAGTIDTNEYSNGKKAVEVISFIRRWKHDNGMALNAPISEIRLSKDVEHELGGAITDIKGAMNISSISFGSAEIDIGNGVKISIVK